MTAKPEWAQINARTKHSTITESHNGSNNQQRINNSRTTALERTVALKFACRTPYYFNVSSKRNNIIKLTHYDETEKRAHDTHIIRANENIKLSHGGPSYSQASGTNPPIKALRQSRH